MTYHTADPPRTLAALAALAVRVQKNSYLPPRRSLAKDADAAKAWFTLDPDEKAAVGRAAEYARGTAFDQEINSALFRLQGLLQSPASKAPAELCQDATISINDLLQTRATGQATRLPGAPSRS